MEGEFRPHVSISARVTGTAIACTDVHDSAAAVDQESSFVEKFFLVHESSCNIKRQHRFSNS
jgi:hypothetical protein